MRAREITLVGLLGGTLCLGALLQACGEGQKPPEEKKCDLPAIFEQCSGRVCHGSTDPAAGLDLVSSGRDGRLFGIAGSDACANTILVEPGYPEFSLLYEKLTEDEPSCGRAMPPKGRLSDFDLDCISEYITKASGQPSCETCGGILCIDLDSDADHCGTCDTACGEGKICAESKCIDPCSETTTLCGSSCADLETDPKNCGSCGHICVAGTSCTSGVCTCDADLPDVSFDADVLPIFEASCGGSDCHTGKETLSSLILDPSSAHANLALASDGCRDRVRVVPGNPDESYLLEKVAGGKPCVGKTMPMFADPLDDELLRKLSAWICAGALDD